jgi:8-oxo-dGTP diphosphatase
MKENTALSKKEREEIFRLFLKKKMIRFNEIEKKTKIKSNTLSYHLDLMIKENFLQKNSEYYELTEEGKKKIPFLAHITGKEQGPLTVVISAITNKNKICLLRRANRPYQRYWGMIGGKLKLEESIEEGALREVKEETGLDCNFQGIRGIMHERVKNKKAIKHSFILILCELKCEEEKLQKGDEGEIEWFSFEKLPAKIIPSDKIMIEKLLKKEFSFKEIILTENEDEELTEIEIL